MDISELTKEYDLKKFKIKYPKSLFTPSPSELAFYLSKMRCPICLRKIYFNRNKTIARCKSIRKDGFIVRAEVLKKYLAK